MPSSPPKNPAGFGHNRLGKDLAAVQQFMVHTSPAVPMPYIHIPSPPSLFHHALIPVLPEIWCPPSSPGAAQWTPTPGTAPSSHGKIITTFAASEAIPSLSNHCPPFPEPGLSTPGPRVAYFRIPVLNHDIVCAPTALQAAPPSSSLPDNQGNLQGCFPRWDLRSMTAPQQKMSFKRHRARISLLGSNRVSDCAEDQRLPQLMEDTWAGSCKFPSATSAGSAGAAAAQSPVKEQGLQRSLSAMLCSTSPGGAPEAVGEQPHRRLQPDSRVNLLSQVA